MNINLPQVIEVRSFLERLGHAQVQQLSIDSGVPFTTLWKIRDGTTTNPGIETVRKFYPATEAVAIAQTLSALPIDRTELSEAIKSGLIKDERQQIRRVADRKKGASA